MIWEDLKDLTFPSAVELNLLADRRLKYKSAPNGAEILQI